MKKVQKVYGIPLAKLDAIQLLKILQCMSCKQVRPKK